MTRIAKRFGLLILSLSLSLATVGCFGGGKEAKEPGAEFEYKLIGSGASFPAPLYLRWFAEMNRENPDFRIEYQSVGSGAGIRQFSEGVTMFGASDVLLKDTEIAKIEEGVLMLPVTAGAVVLSYNLPGNPQILLSREVYVDIFLGEIVSWDDPRIAALNPDLQLPNLPITVVHRSDSSGTTSVFTLHLSEISDKWEQKVGSGKSVAWPSDTDGVFVGGAKNDGVTAQILQVPGAIGYIEYGFATLNSLPTASLENQSGNFVIPTLESATIGLDGIGLTPDLTEFAVDPIGEGAYPIVTYTRLLIHPTYPTDADGQVRAEAIERMLDYAINEGQLLAPELGYIPIPQSAREAIELKADGISDNFDITVRDLEGIE